MLEFQGGGGAFVLDPVVGHFQELFDLRNVCLGGAVAVGFDHAFKDVFFRSFRQMNHVVIIEAVIAQFVHHDFVAREVIDACGNLLQGLFYAEQNRRLGKVVPMSAIAHVPNRRYGKDDANVAIHVAEQGDDPLDGFGGFFDRNQPAFKLARVLPVTIRCGFAAVF